MGKILDDCIHVQKMNGTYYTPLGRVVREMMEDMERQIAAEKRRSRRKDVTAKRSPTAKGKGQ